MVPLKWWPGYYWLWRTTFKFSSLFPFWFSVQFVLYKNPVTIYKGQKPSCCCPRGWGANIWRTSSTQGKRREKPKISVFPITDSALERWQAHKPCSWGISRGPSGSSLFLFHLQCQELKWWVHARLQFPEMSLTSGAEFHLSKPRHWGSWETLCRKWTPQWIISVQELQWTWPCWHRVISG